MRTDAALSYQDMLRVLGALLDAAGSVQAALWISPTGAKLTSPGWAGRHDWPLAALHIQHDTQCGWRGAEPLAPGGGLWAWGLRLIGAELDAVGAPSYVLLLRPSYIRVRSPNGYHRTFDRRGLAQRAFLAPHLRG